MELLNKIVFLCIGIGVIAWQLYVIIEWRARNARAKFKKQYDEVKELQSQIQLYKEQLESTRKEYNELIHIQSKRKEENERTL